MIVTNDERRPPPQHVGGQGSTLILLHGLGGTWEIWKPLLPALEAQHRVIAMTLPGHYGGPEYAGSGDATIGALAEQIIATLRAQGIERAHVVGNSLGGWLSIELARRRFARSVVAFSPAGGWHSRRDYEAIARSFRIFYALVDVVRFLSAPFTRFEWMRKALASQTIEHPERIAPTEFRALLRAASNARILPGLLRTMGQDGPVAPLTAGEAPIRIAWGGCDRVIPFKRYGEPYVERIKGAVATFVSGVGHVPMYDDPAQLVANILAVTGPVDAAEPVRSTTSYTQ